MWIITVTCFLLLVISVINNLVNHQKIKRERQLAQKELRQAEEIKIKKFAQQKQMEKMQDSLIANVHLLQEQQNSLQRQVNETRLALSSANLSLQEEGRKRYEKLAVAANEYDIVLEQHYQTVESEYKSKIDKLNIEKSIVQKELNKMRATQEALIEARVREQEVKNQITFYCLPLSDADKHDIEALEKIKVSLNKPRILSMLIWSTFFQKQMTALCNNVLGTKGTICGIYKITNQITDEVYIGQAVDIATRWKTHAKCGLDIDRPQNNKLYQAMRDYGIQNFSWELLEACDKKELNEKEKYYIELYDSCHYGYNSNIGISKT